VTVSASIQIVNAIPSLTLKGPLMAASKNLDRGQRMKLCTGIVTSPQTRTISAFWRFMYSLRFVSYGIRYVLGLRELRVDIRHEIVESVVIDLALCWGEHSVCTGTTPWHKETHCS